MALLKENKGSGSVRRCAGIFPNSESKPTHKNDDLALICSTISCFFKLNNFLQNT